MRLKSLVAVLALPLLLTSCSQEKRDVTQYLDGLNKAVLPAVQQGKVVQNLATNTNAGNFGATWPVLLKNVQDLQTQVGTAVTSLKAMPVPAKAATVQQLANDELDTLTKMCTEGADVGGKLASTAGKPFQFIRALAENRMQLDELKQLQAHSVEVSTKLENEISNLKRDEGIP